MRIFVITEAGSNSGYGHLTRCQALCEAFLAEGNTPIIALAGDFPITVLEKKSNMDFIRCSYDKREDLLEMICPDDIVVIDSYILDKSFYTEVAKRASILVSVDDFCRIDYPKGIILNGLVYAEELNYPKNGEASYLLGNKYSLLRESFSESKERIINKGIRKIFVTFGGGKESSKFLTETVSFLLDNCGFFIKALSAEKLSKDFNFKNECFEVLVNASDSDIRRAMESCDLCISGGGLTIYELAVTGTPTLGICFAENQKPHLEYWERLGFLVNLGWFSQSDIFTKLLKAIENFDYEKRKKMSDIGTKLIDGLGAKRAASEIIRYYKEKKNV